MAAAARRPPPASLRCTPGTPDGDRLARAVALYGTPSRALRAALRLLDLAPPPNVGAALRLLDRAPVLPHRAAALEDALLHLDRAPAANTPGLTREAAG